jgi:DNA-binding Lrp family transcriptional regulator
LLGFDLEAYAMVRLNSQSEADLQAFEKLVRQWPLVRECAMLSGEIDFLLKCVAPDLAAFQNFVIRELTAAPHVAQVRTALTIRMTKLDAGVPLG